MKIVQNMVHGADHAEGSGGMGKAVLKDYRAEGRNSKEADQQVGNMEGGNTVQKAAIDGKVPEPMAWKVAGDGALGVVVLAEQGMDRTVVAAVGPDEAGPDSGGGCRTT